MNHRVIILSADTSCDESSVAILDTERWVLLSDVVHSHVGKMKEYGGVVPEIASREHLKALPLAFQEALRQAGLKANQIDWFTVTNRPGLIGALLVGVSFIKTMAYSLQKPFSVIDHIEGHLYSPLLATLEKEKRNVPPFPWIALVVSGGHSEIYLVKNEQENEWIGGTVDDAAGEAFDKIGKLLGLSYPAGPLIDRWVKKEASPEHRSRFNFPKAQLEGFDLSFSGLKTAVMLQLRKLGDTPSESERLAVAASAQEAILIPLVERARRAQMQFGVSQLVITGGVACNSRLRELAADAYFPEPRHCTDNAAMIALVSAIRAKANLLSIASWETTASAKA